MKEKNVGNADGADFAEYLVVGVVPDPDDYAMSFRRKPESRKI